ncbi:hypothetical protein CFP56_008663 [Quercus suber]|uniref:Uncharacterized protein n=1 Tax=Quercus suber TaxID=58331 RepID=A0AAW0M6T1_QUESU
MLSSEMSSTSLFQFLRAIIVSVQENINPEKDIDVLCDGVVETSLHEIELNSLYSLETLQWKNLLTTI